MCGQEIIALVDIKKTPGQLHTRIKRVRICDIDASPQYRVDEIVTERAIDPIGVARDWILLPPIQSVKGLLGCQIVVRGDGEISLEVYRDACRDKVADHRRARWRG